MSTTIWIAAIASRSYRALNTPVYWILAILGVTLIHLSITNNLISYQRFMTSYSFTDCSMDFFQESNMNANSSNMLYLIVILWQLLREDKPSHLTDINVKMICVLTIFHLISKLVRNLQLFL